MEEIVSIMRIAGEGFTPVYPEAIESNVLKHAKSQLFQISDFFTKGRVGYEN
jgi:hypothetical protein